MTLLDPFFAIVGPSRDCSSRERLSFGVFGLGEIRSFLDLDGRNTYNASVGKYLRNGAIESFSMIMFVGMRTFLEGEMNTREPRAAPGARRGGASR